MCGPTKIFVFNAKFPVLGTLHIFVQVSPRYLPSFTDASLVITVFFQPYFFTTGDDKETGGEIGRQEDWRQAG